MHRANSGQAHGTNGSPQTTLEQQEYGNKVTELETALKCHHDHIQYELPKSSPLKIPGKANIKEEHKTGYEQVKYTWQHGKYRYTCRWHTRTPNAPKEQGDSWVVERKVPGIGYGPNARPSKSEVLIGKTPSGKNIWVDKKKWNDAIRARKNNNCSPEQKEMLDNGHWKA